jgi:hypothetical protein
MDAGLCGLGALLADFGYTCRVSRYRNQRIPISDEVEKFGYVMIDARKVLWYSHDTPNACHLVIKHRAGKLCCESEVVFWRKVVG